MSKKKNTGQLGNPAVIAKVASKAVGAASAAKSTVNINPSFFTLIGFGVLGLIGYSLTKKIRRDNEDRIQDQKETDFSNNLNTSVLNDSTGASYNPRELASRYKQAIYGAGTSEQAIMDLARISKNGRWSNISSQYKILTGGVLLNDIQGELSTNEYNIFINIQKSPYWYAIGEYVYPKKTSVKALDNANKVITASVYWNVGSLGKVTAIKRALLNGKQTEFYKTEDYPDYWIWVDELYTSYDRMG